MSDEEASGPKLVRMTDGTQRITIDSANKSLYEKLLGRGWEVIENPPEGVMGNLQASIKLKPKVPGEES